MSNKLHLCCGSTYLKGYYNCDIKGENAAMISSNPNETDLEHYFKNPWEPNVNKRIRSEFIVDILMDIKKYWNFASEYYEEIVMISCFEHFEHLTEIPHIVREAHRVLKPGGVWKFDFPDIVKQVEQYRGKDDEFMMELIYCNHRSIHARHEWGYTYGTIGKYLTDDKWDLEFKPVVEHSYPMLGVWATKK